MSSLSMKAYIANDNDIDVELALDIYATRYVPATHFDPAEGGDFEVEGCQIVSRVTGRGLSLSDSHRFIPTDEEALEWYQEDYVDESWDF